MCPNVAGKGGRAFINTNNPTIPFSANQNYFCKNNNNDVPHLGHKQRMGTFLMMSTNSTVTWTESTLGKKISARNQLYVVEMLCEALFGLETSTFLKKLLSNMFRNQKRRPGFNTLGHLCIGIMGSAKSATLASEH